MEVTVSRYAPVPLTHNHSHWLRLWKPQKREGNFNKQKKERERLHKEENYKREKKRKTVKHLEIVYNAPPHDVREGGVGGWGVNRQGVLPGPTFR